MTSKTFTLDTFDIYEKNYKDLISVTGTTFALSEVTLYAGPITMDCVYSGDSADKIKIWNNGGNYSLRLYKGLHSFTFRGAKIHKIEFVFTGSFGITDVSDGWVIQGRTIRKDDIELNSVKVELNANTVSYLTSVNVEFEEEPKDEENPPYEFPQDKLTPVVGEQSLKRTMLIVADGMTHEIGTRRQEFIDVRASIPVAFNKGAYQNYDGGLISIGPNDTSLNNVATYVGSIALGIEARATNDPSIAIGFDVKASGKESVVIGSGAGSSGEASLAIGNLAVAEGICSTAIGKESRAVGDHSLALQSKATTDYEVAIGTAENSDYTKPLILIGGGDKNDGNGRIFIYGAEAGGPAELGRMSLQEYLTDDKNAMIDGDNAIWDAIDGSGTMGQDRSFEYPSTVKKAIEDEAETREEEDKKEAKARTDEDTLLWNALDGTIVGDKHKFDGEYTVANALENEKNERTTADENETEARVEADTSLWDAIDGTGSSDNHKFGKESTIKKAIEDEETARLKKDTELEGRLSTLEQRKFIQVCKDGLPPIDEALETCIYLVNDGKEGVANDIYSEYVKANGSWEKLGDFRLSVDLANYYTQHQINEMLAIISGEITGVENLITKDFIKSSIVNGTGSIVGGTINSADVGQSLNFEAGKAIELVIVNDTQLNKKHIRVDVDESEFMDAIPIADINGWLGILE